MKVSRPKKVVSLAETQAEPTGWSGFAQKYGNTIATAVLVAAAVFMFIRWRTASAERLRNEVASLLQSAQSQVQRLRNGRFGETPTASPADVMKSIQQTQTQASSAIASLIGDSDADVQVRAQAFVLRGDMYWYLANLPPLAGSDSEPTLRLSESSDTLLSKAAESYQQVLRDPAFAEQHQQLNAAHLGLAAIAENKSDWDGAKKEFEAVINDTKAVDVLSEQAKAQLDAIKDLKQAIYVAPPSGVASTPPAPLGPPMPASMPTTQLTTMPSIGSIALPQLTAPGPTTKPVH